MTTNQGTTNFLNFSEALNHLRWGERIARRVWDGSMYVEPVYRNNAPASLQLVEGEDWEEPALDGVDIMAEDWYVLGEHQ